MGLVLRILGASALVIGALAVPASAPAAVLYDQMSIVAPPAMPTSTPSMSYEAPNDVEGADDFTVPAGQTWTITEVDALGHGPVELKTDVYFYADAGGSPGAKIFDQDEIAATNGPNYNSPLTGGPVLGPGTYWVAVMVHDFWSWDNSNSLHGAPAAWRNPSGSEFESTPPQCKDWQPRDVCFPTTTTEPDQAFRLLGPDPVLSTPPPPSNAFTFGALKLNKKKGTASLAVTVPGAGTVSLSGKGLKAQQVQAKAAGAVSLTLKATGKSKKALKKKGKAKVKASVTFTPTGGSPATQSKTVKLKKKKPQK